MSDTTNRDQSFHRRGESNPSSKLTESMVIEIRERYAADRGETSGLCRMLAEEFGVSKGLISGIATGKRWSHVGGPIMKPQD